MAKVEFRRNHATPLQAGTLRRRSLMLFLVLAGLIVFATTFRVEQKVAQNVNVLKIAFLSDSLYLIENDTTNYQDFASVLMKQVQKHEKAPLEVLLYLPKRTNYSQFSDIFQIINALDGVKLRLVSEK